jgi:hypothetical protein
MYPSYTPQAQTRDEVFKAIVKRRGDLLREVAFYDAGLQKIRNLEERTFYELSYNGNIFFVQCWNLGRDHVEFRIFSCDKPPTKQFSLTDHFSLSWILEWTATPVNPKNAALYVNHESKTHHFEKLLKGTYRSL